MQEEVTKETIGIGVKTINFTANLLQQMITEYLKNKQKNYRGKMSLNKLTHQTGKLTSIEIHDKNIKRFNQITKKYHVRYSIMKGNQNQYIVFFKADDVDLMEAAFRKFTEKTLQPNKPSIKQKLRDIKNKTMGKEKEPIVLNFNRSKEKAVEL